ncbi:M14 family metallopeptidase [Parapedobacter koreensis]|uniref:Zinc carboxypeptidase n=1 Tax=Parapedobacter koreensis TaxID=332977 RepID=A0A1H7L456_9SPHI|nr:M14 family metallopeptidase [Parapedobacter koreensis]SEK93614.1 Zinc carboxypeptidase [Parapedobacter koreensis]
MKKILLSLCVALLCGGSLRAQSNYSNRQQLAQRVNTLAKSYPQYVKTQSLAKTVGGSDIWMVTIGTGQTDQKPAIAVVGGVEGKHLLGVELAIGFAEKLLAGAVADSVRQLLDEQTFYVFPNMSPDATEQYFAALQYERSGNANKADYDRDGQTGEDGYDDLDGDGKITFVRVEDATGTHILNPDDPRSLIPADLAKGQAGQYLLFAEGIDNDKDGQFNEDGEEGIHFNKNATYRYRNFLPGAGEHAVSEVENRALFDFLYDAFNVYAVVAFGPYNNLSTPEQVGRSGGDEQPQLGRRPGGRKITSWSAQDAKANVFVSEQYNKITGTTGAPKTVAGEGSFAEWAYYHYGRFSFSTPGWWVPSVKADSTGRARGMGSSASDPVGAYLKWAASEGITNNFTEWKAIEHPDFPGKRVEVGGIHPFVLTNPPYALVDGIVGKHTDFVIALAGMAPKVDVLDLKTEKLDNGLTRVSLKVFNSGLLPNLTQVGERSYFLKRIAVNVQTTGNQQVLSGRKSQTLDAIGGRETVELSWLVQGSGKLSIKAGSVSSGTKTVEVTL